MQRFIKAIIIKKRILEFEPEDWSHSFENGIFFAQLSRPGWHAALWCRYEKDPRNGNTSADSTRFLDACRRGKCTHTLDVWIDDEAKVLSARWNAPNVKVISFRGGSWEHRYFRLPQNLTKRQLRERRVAEGRAMALQTGAVPR